MKSKFLIALMVAIVLAGCDVEQTDEGDLPGVDLDVEGGDMPEYDVDAPDVDVGMEEEEITVPDIDVDMPDDEENPDMQNEEENTQP